MPYWASNQGQQGMYQPGQKPPGMMPQQQAMPQGPRPLGAPTQNPQMQSTVSTPQQMAAAEQKARAMGMNVQNGQIVPGQQGGQLGGSYQQQSYGGMQPGYGQPPWMAQRQMGQNQFSGESPSPQGGYLDLKGIYHPPQNQQTQGGMMGGSQQQMGQYPNLAQLMARQQGGMMGGPMQRPQMQQQGQGPTAADYEASSNYVGQTVGGGTPEAMMRQRLWKESPAGQRQAAMMGSQQGAGQLGKLGAPSPQGGMGVMGGPPSQFPPQGGQAGGGYQPQDRMGGYVGPRGGSVGPRGGSVGPRGGPQMGGQYRQNPYLMQLLQRQRMGGPQQMGGGLGARSEPQQYGGRTVNGVWRDF